MYLRCAWRCGFSLIIMTGAALAFASTSAQNPDLVIMRGALLSDAPVVSLSDVLRDVDVYTGTTVTVEGSVNKVCQMKGCWIELVSADSLTGIRVTFKNYGFFVPTDSTGYHARLEGTFEMNIFSKDDADHLIAEGVDLTRNPDGTSTEVSFVAVGLELRQ